MGARPAVLRRRVRIARASHRGRTVRRHGSPQQRHRRGWSPGELGYTVPGEAKKYAAVGAGIVKIEDNTVHVLVETAERPEEIDVNRAEKDAEAAREALLQKQSRREYYTTKISLARAMDGCARANTARRRRAQRKIMTFLPKPGNMFPGFCVFL